MASTYSPLKVQLMATGENNTTWGDITNTNLGTALEEAITSTADITFASADVTLTLSNINTTQPARRARLNLIGTTGGVARNLIVPTLQKAYMVTNSCADTITVKNATGAGVAVPAGASLWVYNNATDVVGSTNYLVSLTLGTQLSAAYGGTGLTSPGTAGNILTSTGTGWTSLPAPPTGVTTFSGSTTGLTPNTATAGAITLGGVLVAANGGTGLSIPGTAGNILTSTGTGWISSPAPATGVLPISGGTTGLTPSTPTSGAVTLAGTLAAANGGTGLTSPGTAGNILVSTGTGWTSGAAPASGVTSFSGGTTGLTPSIATSGAVSLAGTLGMANGGTGVTAAGTAGNLLTSTGSGWVSSPAAVGTYVRNNYVATAAQTTFAATYSPPYIMVWVNGVLQSPSDYTATSGTSVILATACVAGDIVELVSFPTVSIATAMLTSFANATAANPVLTGGTGATTAAGARTNLSAAVSGANNDITSITGLTTALSVPQGGTGQTTIAGVRGAVGTGIASRKTANYTAVAGDMLACDTIAVGAFTVTLPATPAAGDLPIMIFDAGTTDTANGFATNNLTVARNGSTIHTLAEDAIISTKGVCVTFEYINGTWRVRIG